MADFVMNVIRETLTHLTGGHVPQRNDDLYLASPHEIGFLVLMRLRRIVKEFVFVSENTQTGDSVI